MIPTSNRDAEPNSKRLDRREIMNRLISVQTEIKANEASRSIIYQIPEVNLRNRLLQVLDNWMVAAKDRQKALSKSLLAEVSQNVVEDA